jgi:hypothetical protein
MLDSALAVGAAEILYLAAVIVGALVSVWARSTRRKSDARTTLRIMLRCKEHKTLHTSARPEEGADSPPECAGADDPCAR